MMAFSHVHAMKSYSIYLNFNGKTEEAFYLDRSVLGGEFTMLQRFKDAPEMGNVLDSEKNMILHVSLSLGKSGVLWMINYPLPD
jgi:PhnB protein